MKIVVSYPCPENGCRGTIDVPVNDGVDVGSTRATMHAAADRVRHMEGGWGCNRCSYRGGIVGSFTADVDAELARIGAFRPGN